MRVADQRAARGEDVVERVGRVLGDAEHPVVGEVEVHLGRRLGPRGELEDETDAVNSLLLAGLRDLDGRRVQRVATDRRRQAEPAADLLARPALEHRPVHVAGATRHRRAREGVLTHRVLEEALRREDRHPPGVDVLGRDHPGDAAKVVDVAVRVHDGGHRPVAAVLAVQREPGGRALDRDQRVDDDDPVVALDDLHVREVEAADLKEAGGDLEQALDRGQPALAPEARGRRLGTIAGEEVVGVRVPDHAAVGRLDPAGVERGDEAAARVLEVLVALGHAAPSS